MPTTCPSSSTQGRGALGDDEERRFRGQGAQGFAERGIRGVVQRGGAVVQNQNVRMSHQRAGDCQALTLTAGQVASALLHRIIELARLLADKLL